ncbi:S-adenosyl-L-methionine-dependent methyltransferase [Pilobolus umbonatus]|nr:S-adenosyl-L-methionine-dependent methyltransferase [Pilobolus umbonatus]
MSELPIELSVDNVPVASEVGENQFLDGRRYNSGDDVKYMLPNDNEEADRLYHQHNLIRYVFQGNFHAPVHEKLEEGITVLDSGCGPAVWTKEMAETYPNSTFHGIDISFLNTEEENRPNLTLQICNAAKDVPFEDDSFDYIHQRLLVFALTKDLWEGALKNHFRILKPGGYIELVETNTNCFQMGPEMTQMQSALCNVMNKRNMVPDAGSHIQSMLEEAGFVNITFKTVHIPINHTSKIGELWWKDLLRGYENIRPMLALGDPVFEDPEFYNENVRKIAEECPEFQTDFVFFIAYAQKPLQEEE